MCRYFDLNMLFLLIIDELVLKRLLILKRTLTWVMHTMFGSWMWIWNGSITTTMVLSAVPSPLYYNSKLGNQGKGLAYYLL